MNQLIRSSFTTVITAVAVVTIATGQGAHPQPVWYRADIARNLTSDGRPDTLLLEARGTRPDSLHVLFRIRSNGREVYREAWSNGDEFEDLDLPEEPRARADAIAGYARMRLEAFLSPDRFASLDTSQAKEPWKIGQGHVCQGDPRDCIAYYLRFEAQVRRRLAAGRDSVPQPGNAYAAFDDSIRAAPFDTAGVRAIWADMRQHTAYSFTMSYGYETTLVIAWSQLAQRFFILFACC